MKIAVSLTVSIFVLVMAMPLTSYAEDSPSDSNCPRHLHQRTVAQVLNSHLAAFQSGNAQLLACDYADDAVFVPQAIHNSTREVALFPRRRNVCRTFPKTSRRSP